MAITLNSFSATVEKVVGKRPKDVFHTILQEGLSQEIIPARTKNYIISDKQLDLMKNGSIFINAGRGQTLDTKALVSALKSGKLAGAGLDVFEKEPGSNFKGFKSELQNFDNVILTPHIGGSTIEAQIGIAEDVIEELIKLIK